MICREALSGINLFPNYFTFLQKTAVLYQETVTVSGFEHPKKFHRTTLAKPCDLAFKNGTNNTYLLLDHIKTGTEKSESV